MADPVQMVTGVDWIVVAVYMLLMVATGVYAKTLVKSPEDYFAAGRRLPWWLAAVSHHMSGYSAFAFVAYAGFAYNAGLTAYIVFAVLCATGICIGAFLWAPRWARLRVLTPVEYLEQRFNNATRQVVAWSGILLKFLDEGAKLFSLAVAVNVCTGWPLDRIIVASGVIAVAYVLLGGLWADAISDFMQCLVQFGVTLLLLPIALIKVGGWSGLWSHPNAPPFAITSPDWPLERILLYGVVVTLSYSGGTWGLAQRFYSVKGAVEARKAALFSALLYLVYPLVILIPVWAARALLPPLEGSAADSAYMRMVGTYLGPVVPGMLGLFASAMFAATMSMVDSDINAMAAVFAKDIYQRQFAPDSSEQRLLFVGVTATLVLGAITVASALAILWVPGLKGPFNAVMEYFAGLFAPVSVPLLLGMVNRRATWRGALGALVGGVLAWVLCRFWLYPAWIAPIYPGKGAAWVFATGVEMAVSFGVFLLDGMVSKQTPAERARVEELFAQLEGAEEAARGGR
jgi:SSS family solute:Na+ symporter